MILHVDVLIPGFGKFVKQVHWCAYVLGRAPVIGGSMHDRITELDLKDTIYCI